MQSRNEIEAVLRQASGQEPDHSWDGSLEGYVNLLGDLGFQLGELIGRVQSVADLAEGESGADPADDEFFLRQVAYGQRSADGWAGREVDREKLDRESFCRTLEAIL